MQEAPHQSVRGFVSWPDLERLAYVNLHRTTVVVVVVVVVVVETNAEIMVPLP